ncbi:NAD-dependent deacylase [Pseudooceanicola sediminis]|uniref:NAD-dependent protein deacylase n=1 Tax=Pseudooceanicola sediminis TaxID=2211117 RepID=A0A399IWP1_9RHOB|nr:NAD-dependent deacylase [Pseudooceanicola sediminis]KAA2312350.1 NAD-dependent deacylase [Puniceibacterium sp. HSS470]RII37400.1 NAD-dependent deacylase [Pseudooceanicola sediminis]|tara:strand:+ start:2372 stop:3073 length:702 start_codon:yes stop_codon:yes gene_type:complete
MENIVILTGAGISAESGLGTFRDAGGLWERHRVEDVASPEGFARDPALVQRFYNARRAAASAARPNAAHTALARLQRDYPGQVTLVTQNVDALHEAAGSNEVLHMHGALAGALCPACGHRWPAPAQMETAHPCPACHQPGARPDIVWFGEMPYHMETILTRLAACSYFVAIGTSGQVYPAAGFVQEADANGAHTLELNLEASARHSAFAEVRQGRASDLVPTWVAEMLAEADR